MGMNEFRRIAANIDQHIQHLFSQDINNTHTIINRMMVYAPDLHKIWTGTSDSQLIALSNEFPGFYRYALIMEEAYEAERNKASRPYDGMAQLPGQLQQQAAQLLTTAAELERGYQALFGADRPQPPQSQTNEMDKLHQQWLSGLEIFKSALRAQGTEPKALGYMEDAFRQIALRIKKLAS
jgi:hypothetical protein